MKKKILVVDDEVGITHMVKRGLEATGKYLVMEENQGSKAIATARQFKPDLVILDVMMPDVDGGTIAADLAETQDMKHIPVVFLTAILTKEEAGQSGSRIGGNLVLAKPVNLKDLITCIDKHIGA
jgi:Response regulators consisting of a CheY-like receiver domain and a winged-helix DNA-binding domain